MVIEIFNISVLDVSNLSESDCIEQRIKVLSKLI